MIAFRADLYEGLRDVGRGEVDSHPQGYARQQHYSWHSGGTVPQDEQIALDELVACRLVTEIPAALSDGPGCVLRLTVDGEHLLSTWNQSSPTPGPADRTHPAVPVGLPGSGVGDPGEVPS